MHNKTYKSWGEIPDSFLFRYFDSTEWTRMVCDEDLTEIDEVFYTTLQDIDRLDVEDYVKIRYIRNYIEKEPMFAWLIKFNVPIVIKKYPYLRDLAININMFLANLDRDPFGKEKTLFILKYVINELYCNTIDFDLYSEDKIINKIADVIFIYKHISGMATYNVREDLELALLDISDVVMEHMDELIHDINLDEKVDMFLRSLNFDPHSPEYESYFIDEFELVRSDIVMYVNNIIMYSGFRDSNFPDYDYDIVNARIANISLYKELLEPIIGNMLLVIYKVVLDTLDIYYEDQIVYRYDEAYELPKFLTFLFKETLISHYLFNIQ